MHALANVHAPANVLPSDELVEVDCSCARAGFEQDTTVARPAHRSGIKTESIPALRSAAQVCKQRPMKERISDLGKDRNEAAEVSAIESNNTAVVAAAAPKKAGKLVCKLRMCEDTVRQRCAEKRKHMVRSI